MCITLTIKEKVTNRFLYTVLLRYKALEELNVSGCNLASDAGTSIAEVLASGRLACTTNLRIDCSNNDLGPCGIYDFFLNSHVHTRIIFYVYILLFFSAGEAFEIVAKSCPQLVELDARMCGFRRESEFAISESVYR